MGNAIKFAGLPLYRGIAPNGLASRLGEPSGQAGLCAFRGRKAGSRVIAQSMAPE